MGSVGDMVTSRTELTVSVEQLRMGSLTAGSQKLTKPLLAASVLQRAVNLPPVYFEFGERKYQQKSGKQ